MTISEHEINRRKSELSNVKNEHRYQMALKSGYKGSKSSSEGVMNHLCSIEKDLFNDLSWKYVNAENSTNFIFIMNEGLSKKLKPEIVLILKKLPKKPDKDSLIFYESSYFDEENNDYNIRLNKIKMNIVIRTWNFEKNEMEFQEAHEIKKIFIKVLFNEGLIIVRTSRLGLAKDILMYLFTEDFDQINAIRFSKDDVLKIVEYIKILRGANLRYESDEEIQSASFSAGHSEKDEKLKNLKKSTLFKKAWEEGELRNCRVSNAKSEDVDSDSLRSKDVITLGMNFIESKIYFKTKVTEEETKKWILNILKNINLKEKINKNYKKDFL